MPVRQGPEAHHISSFRPPWGRPVGGGVGRPRSVAQDLDQPTRGLALCDRRGTPQLRSAVVEDLGLDLGVDQLDSREVLEVVSQRWGSAQPATWNTRITALQSFVSYCQRNKWIGYDPMSLVVRRREPRDQTKAIPYQDLEGLWSRRDIDLREKALWRMLYETVARAGEILALDIEDMDLSRKRAVLIGKGGHPE